MIEFYGAPMSSAGRTHWMLEEVGVRYHYHRVNLRDAEAKREYLKINPGGKVPFIVDGELRLAESCAINFYLAEKYQPALLPATAIGRAAAYQWAFWAMTNLQPEALKVMLHTIMLAPERRDPDEAAAGKQRAQVLLDYFETQLPGGYLIDDKLTVADVIAGSVVNLALRSNAAQPGPKTAAWMEALRSRPGYQKAAAGG